MNGTLLIEKSIQLDKNLTLLKRENNHEFPWYPYGSLSNFCHLQGILDKRPLDSLVNDGSKILDIGAADGDLSFFLEALGYTLDIIDYGPTNFNSLRGARLLKERLNARVGIHGASMLSPTRGSACTSGIASSP